MKFDDGHWILVEFVGGPGDGRMAAIDGSSTADVTNGLVDLFATSSEYRPTRAPGSTGSLDDWAARERSAVGRFERGSPELYLQMVWSGEHRSPAPPRDTSGERHARHRDTPFLQALLRGQEGEARSTLDRAMARSASITGLIETMMAPAMVAIGQRWAAGQLAIAEEARATSIVRRLVASHTPRPPRDSRGRVIVAALADEQHALPTEMAAAALSDDGWRVDHLGAGLPSTELLDGVSTIGNADLLVLSVTLASNRQHSIETAALLEERGLPVLVGGPGQPVGGLQRAAREAVRS